MVKYYNIKMADKMEKVLVFYVVRKIEFNHKREHIMLNRGIFIADVNLCNGIVFLWDALNEALGTLE